MFRFKLFLIKARQVLTQISVSLVKSRFRKARIYLPTIQLCLNPFFFGDRCFTAVKSKNNFISRLDLKIKDGMASL